MKTRTDYVSNSSSCSFVVEDVDKFRTAVSQNLASLDGYDCLKNIEVRIVFPKGFNSTAVFPSKDFRAYSWGGEDVVYADIGFLMNLDADTIHAAKKVYIRTEDIDMSGMMRVSGLYLAMKSAGVPVAPDSERELLFSDNMNECDAKIMQMAFGGKV